MPCVCPQCGGARFVTRDVPYGHADFARLIPCPVCRQDRQPEWLMARAGLLESEQGLSLDDFQYINWPKNVEGSKLNAQRKAAHEAMARVLEERAGWLTFHGDFGSGKSLALKILCCEFIRAGVPALYGNMADILQHLRDKIRETIEGDRYWQRLCDIPVLLIDEVDRYNATGWAQEQAFRLIDLRHRCIHSHVTAFATNDDPHTMLAPRADGGVGYLYSRMRLGPMVLLEGDVRNALGKEKAAR